jgi:hypothetical protein
MMQSLNLKKGESIVLIAGEEIELQLQPGCLLFRLQRLPNGIYSRS